MADQNTLVSEPEPNPDQKWKFAIESYKEAMTNLRHNQTTILKIAIWGMTSLALLASWLLKEKDPLTWVQRIGLGVVVLGFVVSLCVVQRNCSRISKEAFLLVIQVDKAFGCFKKGKYIKDEALFPERWMRLKRVPFWRRVSTSLMLPLLIGAIIVLGIIIVHQGGPVDIAE